MKALSFFTVMVCALTASAADAPRLLQKPLLHEHPTLLDMLRRNNELRLGVGLRPQRINAKLTEAAQDQARYMARTGEFSHYSNLGPQGRVAKFGFRGMVRENIAVSQSTVRGAFTAWQNSGAHWAAITSNETEAGFGYAISPGGQAYWVAVYGTPPASEKSDATLQIQTDVSEALVEASLTTGVVGSGPAAILPVSEVKAIINQDASLAPPAM